MQPGKPIAPDPHFIKLIQYQATKRELFLTNGMVMTAFPFTKMIVTSGYNCRFDAIVSDVQNMTKFIHDSLLWSDNMQSNFFQAVDWLDLCGRNGISLHPNKFQFGQDIVTFAGFEITMDHVKPCQKFTEAIANFPMSTNIHNICSWFGLINQVSYAFASSEKL